MTIVIVSYQGETNGCNVTHQLASLILSQNISAVQKGEPKKVQVTEWPKDVTSLCMRPRRKAIPARLRIYIELLYTKSIP